MEREKTITERRTMTMITSSDLKTTFKVLEWYSSCTKEEYLQAIQPALDMPPKEVAHMTGLDIQTVYQMRKNWWQKSDKKHDFTTAIRLLNL
jgi:hypothetical protein